MLLSVMQIIKQMSAKWVLNWTGRERKQSWPNLRYYQDICLERLRKTMKIFGQDSLYPTIDSNHVFHEYKLEVTAWAKLLNVIVYYTLQTARMDRNFLVYS
jgi:hypothetical protein